MWTQVRHQMICMALRSMVMILLMILTNGLRAIGVKFNITRMLNIIPSETTKILSWGYNLLCEANSFNKNLLTIYCMLSVLWHPGGKGKREDEFVSHRACSRGCFQLRGQINKQLGTVWWVWWGPFARESWVKNGNSGIRLLDQYNKLVGDSYCGVVWWMCHLARSQNI